MRSKRRIIMALGVLLFFGTAGAGLVYVDHERSRPDRVAATARQQQMVTVSDQILRYENEHGTLPRTLAQLVPRYVREEQLVDEDGPLYVFDPVARTLRQSRASRIHGLISRDWPAFSMTLPEPGPETLAGRRARLASVRKGVLRYLLQHDSLPGSLEELVPRYVKADQLSLDDVALYLYDPAARTLAENPESLILPASGEGSAFLSSSLPANGDFDPAELGSIRPSDPTAPLFAENGPAIVPASPKLADPPEGALVFEAEDFSEMNYGWEVTQDPDASGGAYLHSREGISNGPAQLEYGVYNFFDIQSKRELTALRYWFHVPESGNYRVYGRMWTTGSHCSNSVNAGIDASGPHAGYMGNTIPFRWVWTSVSGSGIYLRKGDHYLHIFIHEDGIRLDQFMLVPSRRSYRAVRSGRAYRPNLLTGRDTEWRAKDGPPVHVSFDVARQVISPESPPDCRVVLRKLRDASGQATLRVTLTHAGADGSDWRVAEHPMDLAKMPELCLVPPDFDDLDLQRLPRREFLLTAEVVQDGKVLASNRVTLLKPWLWEASPQLDYIRNFQRGPLDGSIEPKPGDGRLAWKPVEEKSLDHFGVLDFGLHYIQNSLNAPNDQAAYARTRIHVPTSGVYLFLIQTDDQMLLWLDGKLVYRYDDDNYMPVTRSARRRKIRLEAGDHELRMRVNQTITRWQATIRIRTEDDRLSDVVGLPLADSPSTAEHSEDAGRSSAKR